MAHAIPVTHSTDSDAGSHVAPELPAAASAPDTNATASYLPQASSASKFGMEAERVMELKKGVASTEASEAEAAGGGGGDGPGHAAVSGGGGATADQGHAHESTDVSRSAGAGGGIPMGAKSTVYESVRQILDPDSAREFLDLLGQYAEQKRRKPRMDWSKVRPASAKLVTPIEELEACPKDSKLRHELLQKLAIVKLNGGLGTRMGCRGTKGAVEVRSGLTFLDLAVRQVEYLNTLYGVDVPLVLMNSFHTHEETVRVVRRYAEHHVTIHCFTQSCYPRVDRDTLVPVPVEPFSPAAAQAWYPPGHGDVYRALAKSGMLRALRRAGKEFVFISNVDNLGATASLEILYHMVNRDLPCCVEVTPKTRADVSGGTLIEYDGRPRLVEPAQVPSEHDAEFRSLKRFAAFNTNNLWVSCAAVEELVAREAAPSGRIRMPVLVNQREMGGRAVLEVETSAGSIVEALPAAVGIAVSRDRFLPVKTTSDLLTVQSNVFRVRHGSLERNPSRDVASIPVVQLGPEFALLRDYYQRFKGGEAGLPDMLELDHLTVSGNVNMGRGVKLRGTVIVVAHPGSRIDVPDGAVFDNKVVTGSLRVIEH